MAIDLIKAIATKARATSSIASVLSTFDYGDGQEAAIFSREADENASSPRLIIWNPGGTRNGTLDHFGYEVLVNIRVEDDRSGSDDSLRSLAWAVVEAFDETRLTVEDYDEVGVYAEPPQMMDAGLDFPAYLVQLRVQIYKTARKE